jgi:hypothetical protein
MYSYAPFKKIKSIFNVRKYVFYYKKKNIIKLYEIKLITFSW